MLNFGFVHDVNYDLFSILYLVLEILSGKNVTRARLPTAAVAAADDPW